MSERLVTLSLLPCLDFGFSRAPVNTASVSAMTQHSPSQLVHVSQNPCFAVEKEADMIRASLGSVAMCNSTREPAIAHWQSRVRIRGLRFT
jgi:hypothetical protein